METHRAYLSAARCAHRGVCPRSAQRAALTSEMIARAFWAPQPRHAFTPLRRPPCVSVSVLRKSVGARGGMLQITRLSSALGARVDGVDLSQPLDDATVAAIRCWHLACGHHLHGSPADVFDPLRPGAPRHGWGRRGHPVLQPGVIGCWRCRCCWTPLIQSALLNS